MYQRRKHTGIVGNDQRISATANDFHQLTHVDLQLLFWGEMGTMSNNREECTKKRKSTNERKKKISIKRPQIKIPAHLENTGMSDNNENKISQEDEVQWSVAVQPSVGERLSSETLWYLDFFHLATQTNCMFKTVEWVLELPRRVFKVWFDASLNDSLETKMSSVSVFF